MCAELETWRYETMIALVNLPVVSKTNRWDSLPVCSISAFACSSYKKYSPAACRRYVSYVSYKREAAVLWAVRGRKGFTNWSLSLPLKVLSTSIPLFFQLGACFPNYIFTFFTCFSNSSTTLRRGTHMDKNIFCEPSNRAMDYYFFFLVYHW